MGKLTDWIKSTNWKGKLKETEGRKGLLPWLSVRIQKWILIAVACIGILVIVISIFSGGYLPAGLIFTIVAPFAFYIGIKTNWLKDIERVNKPIKIVSAIVIGAGALTIIIFLAIAVFYVVVAILAIIFVFMAFFFILMAWLGGDEVEVEHSGASREDKYIIKKEHGKEIVYEKGLFDRRVGELHENWDGSKETRTIFEPHIKVDKPSAFSGERKAEIEDQKGVFKKGFLEKQPTFYPDEESEGDEDDY